MIETRRFKDLETEQEVVMIRWPDGIWQEIGRTETRISQMLKQRKQEDAPADG